MDSRLVAVAVVVLASACVHTGGTGNGSSGEGLVIESFTVSDQQLTPGQSAIIRLRLKNYHTQPTSIEKVSLYNTGFLEASKQGCEPASIGRMRRDFAPQMECSWEITAPEDLGGFESRAVTMNLNLRYQTTLSNGQQPMKVRFQQLEDITRRQDVAESYSNGEVAAEVSLENPVPLEGGIIRFSLSSTGPGRVNSDYSLSYRPSSLFDDCPSSRSPSEGTASFSCELSADSPATRNLVFSTSYKYVKSPSLDIEVARP